MTDFQTTPAILSENTLLRGGCPLHCWTGGVMPLWAEREKHAVYQIILNAGHNANQDNPEFTNQAILAFLHQHAAV